MKRLSKSYQTDGFNIDTDTELKAIQAKYPECSKDKLVNFEKSGMSGFGEVGYKFNEHNNDLSVYVIESFVFMDVDTSQGQQINKLVYIAQKLDVSNENIDNEPMYVSDAFVNEGKNTFNLQARKRYLAKFQTNLNIKPLKNECKNYQDLKTELIKELGKEKVEQGLAYEQGRTLEDAHKEFNKTSSFKRLIKATLFDGEPITEEELKEEQEIAKKKKKQITTNTGFSAKIYIPMFEVVNDNDWKNIDDTLDIIGLEDLTSKCSDMAQELLFGARCNLSVQYGLPSVDLYINIYSPDNIDFDYEWIRASKSRFQTKLGQWYRKCLPLIDKFKQDVFNSMDNKNIKLDSSLSVNEIKKTLTVHTKQISQYDFEKQYSEAKKEE